MSFSFYLIVVLLLSSSLTSLLLHSIFFVESSCPFTLFHPHYMSKLIQLSFFYYGLNFVCLIIASHFIHFCFRRSSFLLFSSSHTASIIRHILWIKLVLSYYEFLILSNCGSSSIFFISIHISSHFFAESSYHFTHFHSCYIQKTNKILN